MLANRALVCSTIAIVAIVPHANAQPPVRNRVECSGQPISRIEVETYPPFERGGTPIVTRTAQMARRLHANSRPSLIRRYLALDEGAPCTELRRSESERILRAQPFVSDAFVMAYEDGSDSVAIRVVAVDEISLILDGSISSDAPHVKAVRVGNANLSGAGIHAAVEWRDGDGFRDAYGIRLVHYQLLGRPYQLETAFIRRNVGHDLLLEASHPYLTDLQRVAWRTHYGERDSYTRFLRQSDTAAWLGVEQSFADIGGVIRIGGPGLLALAGGSISQERDDPATAPVLLERGAILPDTSTALINRYPSRRQTRVNALFGLRDLRFIRVTGFESLDGAEDVPRGFQFSGLLGRGMRILDQGTDRGIFASTSLYGGFGSERLFLRTDVSLEARRENSARRWVGVISSAHARVYARRIPRHTMVGALEWSGGWDSRVPFQLSFAEREGGLRGFSGSRIGGGQRLVVRLEDRYQWGRFRHWATLGLAGFTDIGKLWAGDVPFGADSRLSASLGVSLLASIPPQSQRLVRLDLAYPLNPDAGRGWDVRVTSTLSRRLVWREPRDVRDAREHSVPSNVFNWP